MVEAKVAAVAVGIGLVGQGAEEREDGEDEVGGDDDDLVVEVV